jgi:uncharacterized protein YndB with AHSA1/START domain
MTTDSPTTDSAATRSPTTASARVERTFAAPPDSVYRAWLDPDLLGRWMAPGDMQVARAEVDERVGGAYRIWQAEGDQAMGGFEAEIVELVPDRRIVARWAFVGPERTDGPTYDSLLTVELTPTPEGGTHLVLVHDKLDALAAAMPDAAALVGPGWLDVLAKLAAALQA